MAAEQRPPVAPASIAFALCPQVALYASRDVDALAQGNGLENLAQLLKPWQGSVERVTLRTSTFVSHQVPVLPLLIDDSRDLVRTELDAIFLDDLATSFERKVPEWLERRELLDVGRDGNEEHWRNTSIDDLTPWYAYYRKALLSKRLRTEYETFGHPVACIIAVSTSNPEPLNAFAALYEATSPENLFAQAPWVDRNVLRYYVLVHDLSTGPSEEHASLLEDLRRAYGVHCGFLALNSEIASRPDSAYTDASQRPQPKLPDFSSYWTGIARTSNTDAARQQNGRTNGPDSKASDAIAIEAGKNLGEEDVRRIKAFLREFTVQSLVPWLERVVSQTNEQLAASRKGIAGRLFTAGRRYFGSRPASPAPGAAGSSAYDAMKGVYPHQAQEAQTRRLADLAFMIGDFRLAAAMYEIARKDFFNDKAWRHYASASRMAGLTGLLLSSSGTQGSIDADANLQQAAEASPHGSSPLDELRSLCLYYELYSASEDWAKASSGLSRSASDIEELPSAIMLEQAAIAVLRLASPARRKFALLMSIAAHRYQKTGSKTLARRCGLQAISLYPKTDRRGWQLARNHLNQTLGRQAYNLGNSQQAILHFASLVTRAEVDPEDGSELIDESFLDDFKLAWDLLGAKADEVASESNVELQDSVFDIQASRMVGGLGGLSSHREMYPLEEQFLRDGYPHAVSPDVKRSAPMHLLPRRTNPAVVQGDEIDLVLHASNHLSVPVTLEDIRVMLSGDEECVNSVPLPKATLLPKTFTPITIQLKSVKPGSVRVEAVSCRFNGMLRYQQSLTKKGRRLYDTKAEMQTPTYGDDTSLKLDVLPSRPILAVQSTDLPDQLFAGQTGSATLNLTNQGNVGLAQLRVLCDAPHFLSFGEEAARANSHRIACAIPKNLPASLSRDQTHLTPGQRVTIPVQYRGSSAGRTHVRCLFVFEDLNADSGTQYTASFSHTFDILPSLDFFPSIHADEGRLELGIVNTSLPEDLVINRIFGVSTHWKAISDIAAFSIPQGQAETALISYERISDNDLEPWQPALAQLERMLSGRDFLQSTSATQRLDLPDDDELPAVQLQHILAARRALRMEGLREQFPILDADAIQATFPLFTPDTLDVVVRWHCQKSGISGFHYLADLPVGARADISRELLEVARETGGKGRYEESEQARQALLSCIAASELSGGGCPVQASQMLQISTQVGGKKQAQIELRHNGHNSVDCAIELLGADSPLGRPHPPVRWAGRLLHRRTLQVGATAQLTFRYLPSKHACDSGAYLIHVQENGRAWTLVGTENIIPAG